jgi:hypothetical protein
MPFGEGQEPAGGGDGAGIAGDGAGPLRTKCNSDARSTLATSVATAETAAVSSDGRCQNRIASDHGSQHGKVVDRENHRLRCRRRRAEGHRRCRPASAHGTP